MKVSLLAKAVTQKTVSDYFGKDLEGGTHLGRCPNPRTGAAEHCPSHVSGC